MRSADCEKWNFYIAYNCEYKAVAFYRQVKSLSYNTASSIVDEKKCNEFFPRLPLTSRSPLRVIAFAQLYDGSEDFFLPLAS
jgi:hypothetical protein